MSVHPPVCLQRERVDFEEMWKNGECCSGEENEETEEIMRCMKRQDNQERIIESGR